MGVPQRVQLQPVSHEEYLVARDRRVDQFSLFDVCLEELWSHEHSSLTTSIYVHIYRPKQKSKPEMTCSYVFDPAFNMSVRDVCKIQQQLYFVANVPPSSFAVAMATCPYVQTPKKASDTIADFPSVQHEQNFGTRGDRKKKYRCRGFSSFQTFWKCFHGYGERV